MVGSHHSPENAKLIMELITALENEDVIWSGTTFGVVPTIHGEAARRLMERKDDALPYLLDALTDSSKFVAAHVMLTFLTGVSYPVSPWNGLPVDITFDGSVEIGKSAQSSIIRQWRDWSETNAGRFGQP